MLFLERRTAMAAISVLSLNEFELWKEKLSRLPFSQQDVYFTPEYYSLYQNYGDGEALCFVYEKDGEIVLYPFLRNPIKVLGYKLPKEYYDIQGAYGYNGIVVSSNSTELIESFWFDFNQWCLDTDVVAEFSRFHPLLNNHILASPQMKTFFSRHTVTLDLTNEDIWMHQISSKNRNMIRKAEKEGVTIIESDDYETFRKLYNGTMSDLHADDFYFFPSEYYNEYKQTFKDKSLLCFAIYEGKVIAGSMFMFSADYAHYHLSARDRNYSRYAANNLILWYGIQKAKERGCKWFHFGGGTTGDENDTLLKFKREFSKTVGEFWIGKRVHNNSVYNSIIDQWKKNFPIQWAENNNRLLGYRNI